MVRPFPSGGVVMVTFAVCRGICNPPSMKIVANEFVHAVKCTCELNYAKYIYHIYTICLEKQKCEMYYIKHSESYHSEVSWEIKECQLLHCHNIVNIQHKIFLKHSFAHSLVSLIGPLTCRLIFHFAS